MNRVGCQEPTFRWCAEYSKTEGRKASKLAEAYGLKPHEWQEKILEDWLAVDENGKLINSYCILEVPRQNGKTGVSDPRETWGLIARGEQILHTAQEFQTAKKAFDRLRKKFGTRKNDPFAEFPELNALVDHYTVSAGQMVLDLTNGGHIEFRTRGNNSDMGRGGTFDLVVIDEAQSYTEAQDASLSPLNSAAPSGSPQTILMGTPPTPGSEAKGFIFSNSIRMMKDNPKEGMCIHVWAVNEVDDATKIDNWYRTNPSLGYQLLLSALEKDAVAMSVDMFAREHCGFIAKHIEKGADFAIDQELWDSCKSEEQKPEGLTAYGVKFSPDGSEVALCGACIGADGVCRISLIQRKSTNHGIRWLSEWLNERSTKAACVVIDGRNGVDLLIDRISDKWKAKNSVIKPRTNDVIAAATLLTNELTEKTVSWFSGQEDLRESAISSIRRSIGAGWGFGGDNSAPVEAASLALWGVRNTKRDPSRKMRIG